MQISQLESYEKIHANTQNLLQFWLKNIYKIPDEDCGKTKFLKSENICKLKLYDTSSVRRRHLLPFVSTMCGRYCSSRVFCINVAGMHRSKQQWENYFISYQMYLSHDMITGSELQVFATLRKIVFRPTPHMSRTSERLGWSMFSVTSGLVFDGPWPVSYCVKGPIM